MKTIVALMFATLTIAAQGSYVQSVWPSNSLGWNSWNGLNNGWSGWNSWDDHSSVAWPLASGRTWPSAAWPAASLYNQGWNGWYAPKTTVVQANIAKVNPWGLPWASYGHGYNNYLGEVPTAIAANPGAVHVAPLVGHAVNQKLIVA
ncbi:uncharacterized protein LOC131685088 [Topomyia yanbarensis]|uniref:uncharacterized protein LOC131685088 n=1 Tax=Topomyia yanbarensis TaxID=2498891 RepID=UPI00273AFC7C|nr:uncharacterized protein LOC131685088 [Topomyia yanbarensis]